MKKIKCIVAAMLIAALSTSFFACKSDDDDSSDSSNPVVKPADKDDGKEEGEKTQDQPVENAVLTIDYSEAKKDEPIVSNFGDCKLEFSSSTKVYDGSIRLYGSGKLTISADNEITKVAITTTSDKKGTIVADVGTCTNNVWTGNNKAIVLTNSGTVAYITKIEITYKGTTKTVNGTGTGTTTPDNPDSPTPELPTDMGEIPAGCNVFLIDFSKSKKDDPLKSDLGNCSIEYSANCKTFNKEIHINKNAYFTISSDYDIQKVFIATKGSATGNFTSDVGSCNVHLWTGNAKEITFTNTENSATVLSIALAYTGETDFVDGTISSGSSGDEDPENPSSTVENPEAKEETTAPTAENAVKSDWLFIYYYDADNNLNDELYRNMREAEYSLKALRNEDGTPKAGCPSVNMIMLWDGASKDEIQDSSLTYFHDTAALYELGAGTELEYTVFSKEEWGKDNPYPNQFDCGYVYDTSTTKAQRDAGKDFGDKYKVSANTKEFTKQASWLEAEPDMSDPKTLTNYLKWVNERYKADNVVLCFSDHGAGTGKEVYNDSTKKSAASDGRAKRTLCFDDSAYNPDRAITCKNIKDALTASGYTGSNKPKLLWMDVCLQSTVEIATLLSDTADYLLASPNVSVSHNYANVLPKLTASSTAEELGKMFVSEYYHNYETTPYDADSDTVSSSGASMFTMSLLSLNGTKLSTLRSQIESLADALLSVKTSEPELFAQIYAKCIEQQIDDYTECVTHALAYTGSYAILTDIGSMSKVLEAAYPDQFGTYASSIQNTLDDIIVSSYGSKRGLSYTGKINGGFGDFDDYDDIDWSDPSIWDDDDEDGDYEGGEEAAWDEITEKQMYYKGGSDYLTGWAVPVEWEEPYYGLTIVTQSASSLDSSIITSYNAQTGYSSKWGELIESWFKTTYNESDYD